MRQRACLLVVVLASLGHGAFAHQWCPAYLEIDEGVGFE